MTRAVIWNLNQSLLFIIFIYKKNKNSTWRERSFRIY